MVRKMMGLAAALALSLGPRAMGQGAPARAPDVHFVPTRMEVVNAMLDVTKVGPQDVVYDLGSGDGRIVIAAASRHGARGVGIDIDPVRVAESRQNADTARVSRRVSFRQADLFETDLRPATVVTLYLLPSLNVRLLPKLYRELRPGTRIASNAFDMGDWEADSILEVAGESGGTSNVYYWVLPADASGGWAVTTDDGSKYQLDLEQRYQLLTGRATASGKPVSLEDVRLVGTRLDFTVRDTARGEPRTLRFTGHVSGKSAKGTVTDGTGQPRTWTATRTARGRGPLPDTTAQGSAIKG